MRQPRKNLQIDQECNQMAEELASMLAGKSTAEIFVSKHKATKLALKEAIERRKQQNA